MKPRSFAGIERYLKVYWQPLHGHAINKISRAEVATELDKMKECYRPEATNHARTALSALFAWAMTKGLCESNPVIGTEKPAKSVRRERVLADQELAAIWRALPDNDYGRIVRLLILTGSRREEIAGLTRAEADLQSRRLALLGARTKNGLPHIIPLSALAMAALQDALAHARNGRDLIFGERGSFSGWSVAKKMLDGKLKGMKPWRLHDIRRTVATRMAELGVQPHIVEAVLNHVSGAKAGIAGTYNRAEYLPERVKALGLWGQHIGALSEAGADDLGRLS